MHNIQKQILRELLFKPHSRFAGLNTKSISNDHFAFHLKRLVELALVVKDDNGYALTAAGKECANRLDTDAKLLDFERQAKIGVLVVAISADKKILVQQRLKQPYYGFYGFVTGKVKWGETIMEAATRELKEETNLSGELKLVGIEHKLDYSAANALLEDKYFYILRAENLTGKLTANFEGGRNVWLTKAETKKLPDLFDDVLTILDVVAKNKLVFLEQKYQVKRY